MKKKYKISLEQKIMIPAIVKGLIISIKQFIQKPVTVNYPYEKAPIDSRFRGEHYLTKDQYGHMKCVACYMCATACPAECIHIVAKPAPADWEGRDKIPASFTIDMLRCIYCGFCVEACPKDAIRMTNKVPQVFDSRESFLYDIDKLLKNNDEMNPDIKEKK